MATQFPDDSSNPPATESLAPVPPPPTALPVTGEIVTVNEIACNDGPIITTEHPSVLAKAQKTGINGDIAPPHSVPANDEIWGNHPLTFWENQLDGCRSATESTTDASLVQFAQRLSMLAAPQVQPWLDPVSISTGTDLWIVGDLHGDLLALRALTEFASRTSRKDHRTSRLCFLGDLFDDGPYGHQVLFGVLNQVTECNALFVVGNHDLALGWDEDANRFVADVWPHDLADWLNSTPTESLWRKVAMAAINWFKTAPRALLLGDGTMLAHGGCIHADRLELLSQVGGSLKPEALEDLVWLRAHDTSKRKTPNRTTRGCQFGFEDFHDFLARLSTVAGREIHRVIRGHDHVKNRWSSPTRYQGKILTLNAMSYRQREVTGPFVRRPVVVRHRPDEVPEMFQLEIPESIVLRLYAEPNQTECGT